MVQKAKTKRFKKWLWRSLFKIWVLMFCLSVIQVLTLRFINPPCTVNMAWEWVYYKVKKEVYTPPVYKWQNLDVISPHLRKAVMASEDQRFLTHHGFDVHEIKQVAKDIVYEQKIRGASTISMQAARSVFLLPGRNIFRKTAEAYYTVLIELLWSKKRIFEIYLNTVDWGTGVIGSEAAANKYFSCGSNSLSAAQSSLMAAILPSPHKWSIKNPSKYVSAKQRRILKDMQMMPLL